MSRISRFGKNAGAVLSFVVMLTTTLNVYAAPKTDSLGRLCFETGHVVNGVFHGHDHYYRLLITPLRDNRWSVDGDVHFQNDTEHSGRVPGYAVRNVVGTGNSITSPRMMIYTLINGVGYWANINLNSDLLPITSPYGASAVYYGDNGVNIFDVVLKKTSCW